MSDTVSLNYFPACLYGKRACSQCCTHYQPANPDWDELAEFVRDDDCTTGVITPLSTFNFRNVLRLTPPNWQLGTV